MEGKGVQYVHLYDEGNDLDFDMGKSAPVGESDIFFLLLLLLWLVRSRSIVGSLSDARRLFWTYPPPIRPPPLPFCPGLYFYEQLCKFIEADADLEQDAVWTTSDWAPSQPTMMTAVTRKKELREKVDVNFDGRISFLEYLLHQVCVCVCLSGFWFFFVGVCVGRGCWDVWVLEMSRCRDV